MPWAVFTTCCLSHIFFLPTLIQLFRSKHMCFEAIVTTCTFIASFLYHYCDAFTTYFFLSEGKWHRLDNICALSCFGVYTTHLCQFKSPQVDAYVKYATVAVAVVMMEKDPWNLDYTFFPLTAFAMMPIIIHGVIRREVPKFFNRRNAACGFGLLVVSVPLFVAGLNDRHDKYRAYHGAWHCVGGLASWFLWRVFLPI